jgi:hypothetical protein
MKRDEQLTFCRICNNRTFDPDRGLLCKLTNEYATFEDECVHFDLDAAEKQRRFNLELATTNNSTLGDPLNPQKNITNGKIYLTIGAIVMLISFIFVPAIPLFIIAFALIGYGAAIFIKGDNQKNLLIKQEESNEQLKKEKEEN